GPCRRRVWKEPADQAYEVGRPADRARIFIVALRAADQRKRHQPQGRANGCEIDDAALPDLVPDVFLRQRALGGGSAGLKRRRRRRDPVLVGRNDLAVFLDDTIVGRKAQRSVGMRLVRDAPEDAFVNFSEPDANLVVFLFRGLRIQEWNKLARPVAVIAT